VNFDVVGRTFLYRRFDWSLEWGQV